MFRVALRSDVLLVLTKTVIFSSSPSAVAPLSLPPASLGMPDGAGVFCLGHLVPLLSQRCAGCPVAAPVLLEWGQTCALSPAISLLGSRQRSAALHVLRTQIVQNQFICLSAD